MFQVLTSAWALLFGMFLLMIGNGMQGTLLGIRGEIEGFSTLEMSIVMSAYFAGFLGGSRMAPHMIRRVGHVLRLGVQDRVVVAAPELDGHRAADRRRDPAGHRVLQHQGLGVVPLALVEQAAEAAAGPPSFFTGGPDSVDLEGKMTLRHGD